MIEEVVIEEIQQMTSQFTIEEIELIISTIKNIEGLLLYILITLGVVIGIQIGSLFWNILKGMSR